GPTSIFSFSTSCLTALNESSLVAVIHSSTTLRRLLKSSGIADSSKFHNPCRRWFFWACTAVTRILLFFSFRKIPVPVIVPTVL
ncbi:MAG: hypothetical protein ACJ70R_05985, partial [Nitrososphaera sp.]